MKVLFSFFIAFWVFLLFYETSFGQRTWVVGKQKIKWDVSNNVTFEDLSTPSLGTEGTAIYNDANGNLQFYSDGVQLINKNWTTTPNGNNLLANSSSTQSATFVDFPGDSNKVILFAVDAWGNLGNPFDPNEPNTGLTYSIIDKTLDGGKGDIIVGKKNIPVIAPVQEKIAVYPKADCSGYWVVVLGCGADSDKFFTYSVDTTGVVVNNPVVSPVSFFHTNPIGEMDFSPDGKHLAYTTFIDYFVGLFDFNSQTGQFSNPRRFDFNQGLGSPYGVEFSPNSDFLFVACTYFNNQLFRFALNAFDTPEPFANQSVQGYDFGLLSTGPDGKIYMARNGKSYLSAINNPDAPTYSFVSESINLTNGNVSTIGLPGIFRKTGARRIPISINPLFQCQPPFPVNFAATDSSFLSNPAWNMGNGIIINNFQTTYSYPGFGKYLVSFSYTDSKTGCPVTLLDSVKLVAPPPLSEIIYTESRDTCKGEANIQFSYPMSNRWSSLIWTGPNGAGGSGNSFGAVTAPGPYTVTLLLNDTAGCAFSLNKTVSISSFPALPEKVKIDSLRFSSECDSIITYRFWVSDSTLFKDYSWRFSSGKSEKPSFVTNIMPDMYFFIQVSANTKLGNCPRTDTLAFIPKPNKVETVDFLHETFQVSCSETKGILKWNGKAGTSYQFDFGSSYPKLLIENPPYQVNLPYNEPGEYQVKQVSTSQNCKREREIPVSVPDSRVPNLITLNNDQKNETFQLPDISKVDELQIFNRWGNKIFESQGQVEAWRPENIQEAIYFYQVRYKDGFSCIGWLMVKK